MTPTRSAGNSLLSAARKARARALARYSGFKVGAALQTNGRKIYSGCNIENASYGLSVCAERVALLKALSEGVTRFRALAVVTGADKVTPPCGACRQLLWEYCGDIAVYLGNLRGKVESYRLKELLPHAFDRRNL
ncbi:MAG TPA: cytidine deaminase [Vicinamibacteria bacterium]|jgi:cytidine deaminase